MAVEYLSRYDNKWHKVKCRFDDWDDKMFADLITKILGLETRLNY